MGETLGGGVEIECWREVVPVLLHETRRLTVHIQFRSIKFSVLRREFHIKLSSEEDHCFLYKAAVTQDVYQRFAHYHNLDVPFEHFSEYMHHLMHSVKNNHEYGDRDRFFISILAPQTVANVPHSIEFIVTQRQLGCLVQCRRLSLNFSLASDNELKEHLLNGFERFKREKDVLQRRCMDVEAELCNERLRVRELEEKNRYLQRELEFSQTLLKSAETLQKHYESLLKQQQCGYKPSSSYYNSFQTVDSAQSDATVDSATSSNHHNVPLMSGRFPDAASAGFQHSHTASYPTLHPDTHISSHYRRPATTSVHVMGMSVYLDSINSEPSACSATAHLLHCSPKLQLEEQQQQQTVSNRHGSVMPQRKDASVVAPPAFHLMSSNAQQQQPSPLTALLTCAAFESSPSSSADQPPMHTFLTPTTDGDVKQAIDSSHLSVAQPARHLDSTVHSRQCTEASDSKKLTGAAKRKASFHNLTNTNPVSVATVHTVETRQHAAATQKPLVDRCDAPHTIGHPMTTSAGPSAPEQQHFCIATPGAALTSDDQQVVSMDDDSHTAAATLASMPHHLNVLIDEGNADVESFCSSSSAAATALVPFLEAGALHGFLPDDLDANGAVLSPSLGPTSTDAELMDSLAELNDADWRSMKVDDFDQCAATSVVIESSSPASETPRADDASKPSPPMDGVLSYLKCLICDRSFDLGSAHMAQHVTQSRTCSVCGDSPVFESKDELIKHMISHSTRIYACQYCGKENPRIHYLKIHVRSHTGEKPYTCHQCGRGFADASTWRRHERVHTGEKPFQCNICGRKIARRDNVKIHMRSHMRTKQHHAACRTCGKHFTQPHHLMLHERVCSPMSSSCDEKLASDSFCLGESKSSNF